MNTGSSLLLIAFCAAIGYGLYKIHQKKKWRLVVKILGGFCLVGLVIWGGVYACLWYSERPQPIDKLGAISLGMAPVDVTLALGEPAKKTLSATGKTRYIYTDYSGYTTEYLIDFENEAVSTVCSEDYTNDFAGLGVYDREENVTKKLGLPSKTSINKNGLEKAISYEKYGVSFLVAKGSVKAVCATDSGGISYVEEYGSEN
jgi:hypothetical protein